MMHKNTVEGTNILMNLIKCRYKVKYKHTNFNRTLTAFPFARIGIFKGSSYILI